MKAPTIKSLPTQSDLAATSLDEALTLLKIPVGELSLIVETCDAYTAGRLSERYHLADAVVVPDGLLDWGTWMLKDKFGIIKFVNRGT